MEKSIKESELMTVSSLTLAYLGDTVFESYIREYLITENINRKVNDYHKTAVKYVKAPSQAKIIREIESELTEEEVRVYKRGRNQKSNTSAKNANIIDYRCATGFEALIGYLYISKDTERLEYIIKKGIEILEKEM